MATEQPSEVPGPDRDEPSSGSLTTRIASFRRWGTDVTDAAGTWSEHRRKHWAPLDLALRYYERDREALASVLGSAVALRMYLFLIPALVMVVGLAIIVVGKDQLDSMISTASVTGTMAKDISSAASASNGTGFALFLIGLWLTLWAGWSLSRVLAACAGRAWRLDPKSSRASMSAVGALTAMVLLMSAAPRS